MTQFRKLQVKFHFQTRRANDVRIVDDSKKLNKPMELVLGKKFKLEVWEVIVQKMSLNEVAKFTVHKSVSKLFQRLEMTTDPITFLRNCVTIPIN